MTTASTSPAHIDPQQSVAIRSASERQTPLPTSRRFRDALDEGAQRIVANAASLTGVAPLAQSTTATRVGAGRAALEQGGGAGTLPDLAPEVGGGQDGSAASSATGIPDDTMELLEMQRRIGAEQVHFSTLSNVLKARHDTAKSVVGNIR